MPLASSAVSNENYDYLNSEFNRLYDLQESVNKIKEKGTRRKAYRSVMDQKLEFFYRYCIYAETSQEVYKMWLTLSFGERHEALQHYYDIMDKAIAEDNQDLIIAAMNSISSIVTSSPLSDLEKFLRRFNDPSDSLLDF